MKATATCDNCFFKQRGLCAVRSQGEACPTFRPARPEGLTPPRQMRFTFTQERRLRSAWAFPDADTQAALHA